MKTSRLLVALALVSCSILSPVVAGRLAEGIKESLEDWKRER